MRRCRLGLHDTVKRQSESGQGRAGTVMKSLQVRRIPHKHDNGIKYL